MNYFGCDYIFDIDKKVLKVNDKYISKKSEVYNNNKKINNFIKQLLGKISEKKINTEFEQITFKLYNDLKENLNKLISHSRKSISPNNPFIDNNNKSINNSILESFYEFNLNLAYIYYQSVSLYKGEYNITKDQQISSKLKPQKETNLNEKEYLFLTRFGNSIYSICLDIFIRRLFIS